MVIPNIFDSTYSPPLVLEIQLDMYELFIYKTIKTEIEGGHVKLHIF